MKCTKPLLIILFAWVFILSAKQTHKTYPDQSVFFTTNEAYSFQLSSISFDGEIKSGSNNAYFDSTDNIPENPDSIKILSENEVYAKEIIKKYVFAIGSEELLRSVYDRIIDMKGLVQGVETEIIFYQKAPNKLCQEILVSEVEQKIIYDGVNGSKIIGDIKQEITGNELVKLSYDAIMNLILEPESFDVNLQYKGLEKINDRDCYTILLTLPNGAEWLQYYDMETGLKVRDSKDLITEQGNFKQITEFDDYRSIEGIRYPFKIKQYLGSQVLDFTIESIQVNTGISDDVFQIE